MTPEQRGAPLVHPEVLYRRFMDHCRRCPRCHQAGGERAHEDDLCPTGRSLVHTWESAELSWATVRRRR